MYHEYTVLFKKKLLVSLISDDRLLIMVEMPVELPK